MNGEGKGQKRDKGGRRTGGGVRAASALQVCHFGLALCVSVTSVLRISHASHQVSSQVCDFGLARLKSAAGHVATSHNRSGTPGRDTPRLAPPRRAPRGPPPPPAPVPRPAPRSPLPVLQPCAPPTTTTTRPVSIDVRRMVWQPALCQAPTTAERRKPLGHGGPWSWRTPRGTGSWRTVTQWGSRPLGHGGPATRHALGSIGCKAVAVGWLAAGRGPKRHG